MPPLQAAISIYSQEVHLVQGLSLQRFVTKDSLRSVKIGDPALLMLVTSMWLARGIVSSKNHRFLQEEKYLVNNG